jgi:hypothetical protein
MAIIPTVIAILVGGWLGMRWGGSPENIRLWNPVLWQLGAGGVTLWIANDILAPQGSIGVLLRLLALGMVTAFAWFNIRTGGMVLVMIGVGLDFLATLVNWGMPVSESAMVSSGMVDNAAELETVTLGGGRTVGGGIGVLGDIIPLPWGQVISIGDVIWLIGLALVVSSVLRRYRVRSTGGMGGRSSAAPGAFNRALSALDRGPAPRKGPGLHPSRLTERQRDNRDR